MATAKEIWQTLSAIDVSGKTEKKGNLTYLSWAWAWGVLMENYPQARYEFKEPVVYPDETMIVTVEVSIDQVTRAMWLPVLDFKNKAIKNPSAWDVNTTRMRCLTKCLAMFGLGHYIYAGEDLPEATKQENGFKVELFGKFKQAISDADHWLMFEVAERMNDDWWKGSYNSFKTNITEQKRGVDALLSKGRNMWSKVVEEYREHKDNNDDLGMKQLEDDLPEYWRNRLRGVGDE